MTNAIISLNNIISLLNKINHKTENNITILKIINIKSIKELI